MIAGRVRGEANENSRDLQLSIRKQGSRGRETGDARKCVCVCVRVSRWCKLADDSIFLHKDGNCFTTTDGMIIHPPTHARTHTQIHTYAHTL